MSGKNDALTVILEQDLSDEETQGLIAAIAQMRNVLAVNPHQADCIMESIVIKRRVSNDLRNGLDKMLKELGL